MRQAMRSPWVAPPFEREVGWEDGRGMVVKTYACPPNSQCKDLEGYEQGERGMILP